MRPEIFKQWKEALSHCRKVDELLKDNKIEEADKEAFSAIILGCGAIFELSKELKMPELSEIANNVFNEWRERAEKHRTPKERIEWDCRTLKRLSDAVPPDTFHPLR